MNTLSPLYFPDSLILNSVQLPLATIFHQVQLLQPVNETEKPINEDTTTWPTSDFQQRHIPCPLSQEDHQRFLHLIKDIRSQGDVFINQLKMLIIASMSSPKQREEESSRTIISALFPNKDGKQQAEDYETRLDLWQARLTLKLAEILDIEEINLKEQLESIDDLESEMLKQLRSDSNQGTDHLLFNKASGPQSQPNSTTTGVRLKAWATLYRHWDSADKPIWITSRPEAADIIIEMHEGTGGSKPYQFLRLTLPTNGSMANDLIHNNIQQFKTATKSLRSNIENLLHQHLQGDTKECSILAGPLEQQWLEYVERHFPKDEYGRLSITFNLFQGKTFGDILNSKKGAKSPFANAILAVID